jgi:twitching motility protein PilI
MDAITQLPPTVALTRGFTLDAPAAPRVAAEDTARLGFRIGELALMVRYGDGSELTDMPALARLPNTPAWFLGIANLHGALVPVFDLGTYCGMPATSHANRMLLVLSHGQDAAGFVVDGLPHRLRLRAQDKLDHLAVAETLRECVAGVYRIDGNDWMDFRQAALLGRLEDDLTGDWK